MFLTYSIHCIFACLCPHTTSSPPLTPFPHTVPVHLPFLSFILFIFIFISFIHSFGLFLPLHHALCAAFYFGTPYNNPDTDMPCIKCFCFYTDTTHTHLLFAVEHFLCLARARARICLQHILEDMCCPFCTRARVSFGAYTLACARTLAAFSRCCRTRVAHAPATPRRMRDRGMRLFSLLCRSRRCGAPAHLIGVGMVSGWKNRINRIIVTVRQDDRQKPGQDGCAFHPTHPTPHLVQPLRTGQAFLLFLSNLSSHPPQAA